MEEGEASEVGLSGPLTVFPLFVMAICVIVSGAGGLTYSGNTSPFCVGASSGLSCDQSTGTDQAGTTYTCAAGGKDCQLPYNCPNLLSPPPPTYCTAKVGPSGVPGWWLPAGNSLLITTSAASNLGPIVGGSTSLIFGSINASGFIVMIVVSSVIVAITALNFLGSGENAEGIHIVWMCSLLIGLWLIMSASEGFLTGSPGSFFIQLDGLFPGTGTTLYVFLTLLFTLGTIGSVSRSSGGGGV